MSEFDRVNNEPFKEYFIRNCSLVYDKDKDYKWDDISDVLNAMTGEKKSPDYWRKTYQATIKDGNYKSSKPLSDAIDFKYNKFPDIKSERISELERELAIQIIKFRDERNAWNKQNYQAARWEETCEILENKFSSIRKTDFYDFPSPSIDSENDMLIMLTDLHIGATFDNVFGKYNTDIAKKRLGKLMVQCINKQALHKSKKCYIFLGGDVISGAIHSSIQITNKENVIEQVKIATELISSFIYGISQYFEHVYLSSVVGNHTRITKKDDALHDERLDDIISWAIELLLKDVSNFSVLKRNLDTGIVDINIRGKTYIGVHGDYDAFNKSGVQNLVTMLGFVPDVFLCGHLHTCALDEVNGIKLIRGGNLAGSGDQYTIEKRLNGKPSQMVCICNNKGIEALYPIELNN